jgi:hypothetical protein
LNSIFVPIRYAARSNLQRKKIFCKRLGGRHHDTSAEGNRASVADWLRVFGR